jgi:hypothetical protein
MLGKQYQIFKKCVLDIWIIGGHYGFSKGNLPATIDHVMEKKEQDDFGTLIKYNEVGQFKVEGSVTSSTTAMLTSSGPWIGIRALGINLGIRL